MSDQSSSRALDGILMLGTSPETRGGVASVVRVYRAGGLFSRWPVTYLCTHSDGGAARKALMALSAWLKFTGCLLAGRKFLLHVHSASRASFWRKAAFMLPAIWTRKQVIFHLHGGEFMQFYEHECGTVGKRVIRYLLDRSARIIVLSTSWRDAIARITDNEAVHVIVNPSLPWSGAAAPESRGGKSLLFLGRLERKKGIYNLLDAIALVAKDHPDVRLVCGGDGDLEAIRHTANDLSIGDRVEVLGWVDELRKTELLASACIYVLPSFAEGLPMSILEAMSAGLPVVSTEVGGIPEVITDGDEGLLVPAGDSTALASAIGRLLSDPELRSAMGSRGRSKFDSHFHADVVLPRLEAMYMQLGVRRLL